MSDFKFFDFDRQRHQVWITPADQDRARANAIRQTANSNRRRRRLLSSAVRDLRAKGKSWREIAQELGAGVTTVREAYGNHPKNPR